MNKSFSPSLLDVLLFSHSPSSWKQKPHKFCNLKAYFGFRAYLIWFYTQTKLEMENGLYRLVKLEIRGENAWKMYVHIHKELVHVGVRRVKWWGREILCSYSPEWKGKLAAVVKWHHISKSVSGYLLYRCSWQGRFNVPYCTRNLIFGISIVSN